VGALDAVVHPASADVIETLGLFVRKRLEQNRIDDGEDRGVEPDPESDRRRDDGGEDRGLGERPEPLAELAAEAEDGVSRETTGLPAPRAHRATEEVEDRAPPEPNERSDSLRLAAPFLLDELEELFFVGAAEGLGVEPDEPADESRGEVDHDDVSGRSR
jgi:hypothetical protein